MPAACARAAAVSSSSRRNQLHSCHVHTRAALMPRHTDCRSVNVFCLLLQMDATHSKTRMTTCMRQAGLAMDRGLCVCVCYLQYCSSRWYVCKSWLPRCQALSLAARPQCRHSSATFPVWNSPNHQIPAVHHHSNIAMKVGCISTPCVPNDWPEHFILDVRLQLPACSAGIGAASSASAE
jgi:hypothetical protein